MLSPENNIVSNSITNNNTFIEGASGSHEGNNICEPQIPREDLLRNDLLLSSSDPDDSDADGHYVPFNDESSESENVLIQDTTCDDVNIQRNVAVRKIIKKSVIKQQGTKRVRNPSEWLCNKRKANYTAGQAYLSKKGKNVPARKIKLPCSCRMKCKEKISDNERLEIFNNYWNIKTNNDLKRQFIRTCVEMKPTARFRSRDFVRQKENTLTYKLIVNKKVLRVCKVMFLNTLCISNTVVVNTLKNERLGGLIEQDKRGRHTPSNKTATVVIDNVISHIASFPAYQSHYSRERCEKKFLGPDLNIEKMYSLYLLFCSENSVESQHVAKKWVYTNTFKTKFKLSFKPPGIDTCDTCDVFNVQLQDNLNQLEKDKIRSNYDVHLLESKTRYDLKSRDTTMSKQNPKHKVLTVDLQKCLPTPFLTNCISFYKRKLWTFNYTMYDSLDMSAHCMMWDESKCGRGGNEIASAILKWANCNIPNSQIEEITMWADNCYGQNKNMSMIVCFFWILFKYPQIKIINQKFLLKGHTHMEADTVHALIERKRKKIKDMTILTPWDWQQLVRQCSNRYSVYNMELLDFKDFKSLYTVPYTSPLLFRKVDKHKQAVLISKCVHLQVRQENIGTLYFKTSFDKNCDFREIDLKRNVRRPDVDFPETLKIINTSTKPISTKKYNDLISLLFRNKSRKYYL